MVVKRIARVAFVFGSVLTLACGSEVQEAEVAAAPEGAAIEIVELTGQLRDMAWAEEVDAAQALIEQQREHHDPSVARLAACGVVARSWGELRRALGGRRAICARGARWQRRATRRARPGCGPSATARSGGRYRGARAGSGRAR